MPYRPKILSLHAVLTLMILIDITLNKWYRTTDSIFWLFIDFLQQSWDVHIHLFSDDFFFDLIDLSKMCFHNSMRGSRIKEFGLLFGCYHKYLFYLLPSERKPLLSLLSYIIKEILKDFIVDFCGANGSFGDTIVVNSVAFLYLSSIFDLFHYMLQCDQTILKALFYFKIY